MNLIDLVSAKHLMLRRIIVERWRERTNESISRSEGHLLNIINREKLTVSQASKRMNISRQAVHKCAANLEKRDYLSFVCEEGNKKEKYLLVSQKGKEYCRVNECLKNELETEIASILGNETIQNLKALLHQKWTTIDREDIPGKAN